MIQSRYPHDFLFVDVPLRPTVSDHLSHEVAELVNPAVILSNLGLGVGWAKSTTIWISQDLPRTAHNVSPVPTVDTTRETWV